jgi:hypothetical protein
MKISVIMMKQFTLKRIIQPFVFLCFLTSINAQITFVNPDATGDNDGSSWFDSYTNLQDALDNTTEGAIWIKSGIYVPGGDAEGYDLTFDVSGTVTLLGGFDGTEVFEDDRDIVANLTVLSGDVAGDDVMEDFSINKDDNRRHVIVVDTFATDIGIFFDGLTIEGGHTEADTDLDFFAISGGGIFSTNIINVRDCIFRDNYAARGAGVFLNGTVDNSDFFRVTFTQNRSTSQSAGIHIRNASNINIENCDFINNQTTRGAIYPLNCDNVTIEDCLFEGNETVGETAFGGAVFNWHTTNFEIIDTDFINNKAGNGGCIYSDYRDLTDIDPENFVIEGCNFTGNETTDYGASAIYFWNNSFTISDCTFTENISANSAGSIYNGGIDDVGIIENCTFTGGAANFGAAMSHYAESDLLVEGCTFSENVAGTSGAVTVGFKARATFDDCVFDSNFAQFGAAIFIQNDTTELTVLNSEFTSNNSDSNGGAININADIKALVDGCTFDMNIGGSGGAIAAYGTEGSDEMTTISNCIFTNHTGTVQGGAINLQDLDASISNCVFAVTALDGDGFGGAIMANSASAENPMTVDITNSTFFFTVASNGTLGQFIGDGGAELTMTLQNNIFSNSSANDYGVEEGEPFLVSNGGNLSDISDLSVWLPDFSLDYLDKDPDFVDQNGLDLHLQENSPAVGTGIAGGAPDTDIEGNARFMGVDIGAYESPYDDFVSSLTHVVSNTGLISLAPNPAVKTSLLTFDHDYQGDIEIQIVAMDGRLIQSQIANKSSAIFSKSLNVSELAEGNYALVLKFGTDVVVDKLLVVK